MNVSGKRFIIIGDSHSDAPYGVGPKLAEAMTARGATVKVMAIGGSAAFSWLGSKPVCRTYGRDRKCHQLNEVAGQNFDAAIIILGTNDAANAEKAGRDGHNRQTQLAIIVRQLQSLGNKLAPVTIWVGPPLMGAKQDGRVYSNAAMNALYEKATPVFGANAIDSRKLMPAVLGGDGVHLGPKGYAFWADKLAGEIFARNFGVTEGSGVTASGEAPPSVAGPEEGAHPKFPLLDDVGRSMVPLLLIGTALVVYFWPQLTQQARMLRAR